MRGDQRGSDRSATVVQSVGVEIAKSRHDLETRKAEEGKVSRQSLRVCISSLVYVEDSSKMRSIISIGRSSKRAEPAEGLRPLNVIHEGPKHDMSSRQI